MSWWMPSRSISCLLRVPAPRRVITTGATGGTDSIPSGPRVGCDPSGRRDQVAQDGLALDDPAVMLDVHRRRHGVHQPGQVGRTADQVEPLAARQLVPHGHQVERLALRLGAALDSLFMVPKTMNVRVVPKGEVLQVRNVLTNLVDIAGRPTPALVDLLLGKAADPADWSKLAAIRDVLLTPGGTDGTDTTDVRASPLRAVINAGGYNAASLLDEFPSCRLNIFEFLQVAQPLRPRYYSASSSPSIHGNDIAHLTVGLEPAPVLGTAGRDFRGMASRYVHALREGDRLTVFHDSADGFHLQQDPTKPMIFVSAGTGFAPMRAFLWERLAMKNAGLSLAEAALFNGIRSSQLDFLYRDEIERFTAEGVLHHLHIVASRERPDRREHVQDRIREQGALVWRLLAAGGYVYVCGSQPMRAAVRDAFVDVVAEHGSQPRDRAVDASGGQFIFGSVTPQAALARSVLVKGLRPKAE